MSNTTSGMFGVEEIDRAFQPSGSGFQDTQADGLGWYSDAPFGAGLRSATHRLDPSPYGLVRMCPRCRHLVKLIFEFSFPACCHHIAPHHPQGSLQTCHEQQLASLGCTRERADSISQNLVDQIKTTRLEASIRGLTAPYLHCTQAVFFQQTFDSLSRLFFVVHGPDYYSFEKIREHFPKIQLNVWDQKGTTNTVPQWCPKPDRDRAPLFFFAK